MRHATAFALALVVVAACKESSRPKPPPAPSPKAAPARATGTRSAHIPVPRSASIRPPIRAVDVPRGSAPEVEHHAQALLDCTDPSGDCREATYGLVLALKAEVDREERPAPDSTDQTPLPESVKAYVEALDLYAELAGPTDPETAGMQFLAASTYGRYGWPDEALPRYEAVIRVYPDREVAEYAANLLLHTLDRTGQHEELCRWAAQLLADGVLLATKPELRATLASIWARC